MNYNYRYSAKSNVDRVVSARRSTRKTCLACFALLFGLLSAPVYAANTLDNISFAPLSGDSVQVRMHLSGAAPMPGTFTIDNPARLVVDLPDTQLGSVPRHQTVGLGLTRSVQTVSAGGRTRVVFNMVHMAPFVIRREKDDVVLVIGEASSQMQSTAPISSSPATAATGNQITNVDFRRGENGTGRVVISLSNSSMVADISNRGQQKIIVNFTPASVPKKLERRLNVVDFATPVNTIDTYSHGDGVRMEIATAAGAESLSYQTGDTLTIEVKPKPKAEEAAAKKPKYTGQKLSLNFQNIEVRSVLQLLADFTGLNLVTSDSVKGNITLRLKDVPWDEALDIILKARGLGMRRMGNVIMVAPSEEIAAREKLELQAKKQLSELAPLDNESIQVNYAKAADIAALLKNKDNTLLSARGSVSVDERTNKLLIKDTDDNIAAIRKLVAQLDVPVRQVMIETRVVLATDNFSKELGVRFGVTKTGSTPATGNNVATSGNLNATTEIVNGQTVTAPDRYNVNLPVTNLATTAGSIGLAISRLPLGTLVELELSAAQAEGQTEVISSPRVVTANQKEATIESGVEIPYQQATSSGATSVTFKKAVLSLQVTPQITPADSIVMDLTVNKDSPDYANAVLGQPPINTQKVSTQVLVNNGETVVLGGIYEQNKQHQRNSIPFFGDLPIIGALFRSNYNTNQKSELLIFVTPKIMKDNATLQ